MISKLDQRVREWMPEEIEIAKKLAEAIVKDELEQYKKGRRKLSRTFVGYTRIGGTETYVQKTRGRRGVPPVLYGPDPNTFHRYYVLNIITGRGVYSMRATDPLVVAHWIDGEIFITHSPTERAALFRHKRPRAVDVQRIKEWPEKQREKWKKEYEKRKGKPLGPLYEEIIPLEARRKKIYFGKCPEGCVCISDQEAEEQILSECKGDKYIHKPTGPIISQVKRIREREYVPLGPATHGPCGVDKTSRRRPVLLYCYEYSV